MSSKKLLLLTALVLGGLALLAIAFLAPWANESTQSSIGVRVLRQSGTLKLYSQNFTRRSLVAAEAKLENLDTLETDGNGLASLIFENLYRIQVLENSILTIESFESPDGEKILVLLLKRGDLKVEQVGREGSVLIGKNGKRIDAADYNDSDLKQESTEPLDIQEQAYSEELTQKVGLTEAEISQAFALRKSAFFRCYTQLLQRSPDVTGALAFQLIIEPTGKISSAEVVNSNFKDPDFHNCLLDVIKRLEFKSFDSAPISTLFPMSFE
jgi:hypothetical protein